jgi:hypothetical protein
MSLLSIPAADNLTRHLFNSVSVFPSFRGLPQMAIAFIIGSFLLQNHYLGFLVSILNTLGTFSVHAF